MYAQSLLAGAAFQYDVQRFSDDPALNRLDGSAPGWTIFGGGDLGHVALRIEGSLGGTIEDVQVTNLDVEGQSVSVHSSLAHDTRSVGVLAGYTHNVSSRVKLAYLAGASFTAVHRVFTTDAAQLLLVSPSTPPPSAVSSTIDDRFTAFSAGADVFVRLTGHLHLTAGVRAQPLDLQSELSGSSLRILAGAVWRSR